MKSKQALPGLILVIIGIYYLSQQFAFSLPYTEIVLKWPSILFLIGMILSWQGFSNKDDNKMFSGIVLLGLGTLFHGIHTFGYWNYNWPYFTLIISFAFFMKYFVNKRDGITPAIILLLISASALFLPQLMARYQNLMTGYESYWPVILIIIGIYLLFFKKR
ncbi:hypothetical protein CR203_17950 [Salipaludibacillus neizhouensis]|uniref:DUF5668 domain-containing protein n=1 Tax=Salipaludibacillus neizhouensis TaxID=885475 RepID=A0A3A9KMJ4_9BACI|nr:hypothetical protein [Salipaludibacillus neizhouensis]RKL65956.1 hypothetical protein CR203_17950 [Salipaludibacillus neizhouensis]